MKAIPFKEVTTILGTFANADLNIDQTRALVQDGVCVTKWKGTWRDRLRFLFSGVMWLSSHSGEGMPPTVMGTVQPFESAPVYSSRLEDILESEE